MLINTVQYQARDSPGGRDTRWIPAGLCQSLQFGRFAINGNTEFSDSAVFHQNLAAVWLQVDPFNLFLRPRPRHKADLSSVRQ